MKCAWHCCENILTGKQRKFCSSKCKNKFNVNVLRKKLKLNALEYKGGKCEKCGYSKCSRALEFHHLDPSEKDFGISNKGHTRPWETIRSELDKCLLLCSNCHAEIHEEEEQNKRQLARQGSNLRQQE